MPMDDNSGALDEDAQVGVGRTVARVDPDALRLDYEQTISIWTNLVDVRFRLLALVPTLSGAGVGLLGQVDQLASLRVALVALLGLLSVVALCAYDLRNSLLHDFAVHRAKQLEILLQFERTTRVLDRNTKDPRPITEAEVLGGIFSERPRFRLRLLGVQVWHDRALAIAYTASAGSWAAVAGYSLAARLGPDAWTSHDHVRIAVVVSVLVAVALWSGIWYYDCRAVFFKHTLTGGADVLGYWPDVRSNRLPWWMPWNWSAWASRALVRHWLEELPFGTSQSRKSLQGTPDQ